MLKLHIHWPCKLTSQQSWRQNCLLQIVHVLHFLHCNYTPFTDVALFTVAQSCLHCHFADCLETETTKGFPNHSDITAAPLDLWWGGGGGLHIKGGDAGHFELNTTEDQSGWCRDGAVVRTLASHQCGPGSIPRSGVICGLSLLVLYSAPRDFLRVLRFPLSSKTIIRLDLC